ncbi:hypothetical protein NW759_003370 [Fusarium solani]|nr:hypothetical protein NW759_003370 [Fusarium solani]
MLSAPIFLAILLFAFATQVFSNAVETKEEATAPTCTVNTAPKAPVLDDFHVEFEEEGLGHLVKRTDLSKARVDCSKNVGLDIIFISRATRSLRHRKGRPGLGPGRCRVVHCSGKDGVRWCNRSSKKKTLASFGSIADGVQRLRDGCREAPVGGIVEHVSNWIVEIRKSYSC